MLHQSGSRGQVRDAVGLCFAPPERAIVCPSTRCPRCGARPDPVDAVARTGRCRARESQAADYKRNRVASLIAALNVATGEVTQEAPAHHTAVDFLAFLRRLARAYPTCEAHVILDNVSTH